jgi:anti-sigma B factor antagonist
MDVRQIGDGTVRVTFVGRLDTPGVGRVETQFTACCVPAGNNVLADLSQVEFIGSLGVRMFIAVARSLARKNARLFLIAPQAQVREVFDHVSLDEIIPICADETEAQSALGA